MPLASDDDLARSRSALRQARVQAALGIPRGPIQSHRDRLLLPLLEGPGQHGGEFDSLSENSVDVVVSLATAEIDEGELEALSVMLMSIETLAMDGQFARLAILASRLSQVGTYLQVERPHLWSAVEALAHMMQGERVRASQVVMAALTPSEEPAKKPRTSEAVSDLVVLAVMKAVLKEEIREDLNEVPDQDYLNRCRHFLIDSGDGVALSFVDAVVAFNSATWRARPARVLPENDQTFSDGNLSAYLTRRGIHSLFPAQISAIREGATTESNCVVALPTSSGKTFLAELRIVATVSRYPGSAAIYVAPYRLLGRQVLESFTQGLKQLGLRVQDLGSGYDPASRLLSDDARAPDVAIATPERLDSMVRMATSDTPQGLQAAELLERCRLLVFDELQLIGRPGRGPRFEMLLTRLRDRYPAWEFLGLSAASHGADDLSRWLVGREPLSGSRRPTGTLELLWETNGRMLQRVGPRRAAVGELPRTTSATDDAASLILRFGRSHQPVLAVEISRVAAESLAKKVWTSMPEAGEAWRAQLSPADRTAVDETAEEVKAVLGDAHPLAKQISNGIAFHHAGVPTHILRLIEALAKDRLLRLLSATTTVAEGADLPFRVVVIPHLNFTGPSRRLERDLYLNIIGRAGRANVAVEGMVFLLNSDARTLKNVVQRSLWVDTERDRVKSQLAQPIDNLAGFDRVRYYFDVEGQVMGWLGDGSSYLENQYRELASRTFAWFQGEPADRDRVGELIANVLDNLAERNYIVAGSPFRLSEDGVRARLSGLSSVSVGRLTSVLKEDQLVRLSTLGNNQVLTPGDSAWLAWLNFQALETVEHSLWLRRSGQNDARYRTFADLARERSEWPSDDALATDIELLSRWVQGTSLEHLGFLPERFPNSRSLFGGNDLTKLTSDAAEYIGKLSYPVGWVWSGARILAGPAAQGMPSFVKDALEFGVPSESAASLVRRVGLTRTGALLVSGISPSWEVVRDWIRHSDIDQVRDLGLTTLDQRRVGAFSQRLRNEVPGGL